MKNLNNEERNILIDVISRRQSSYLQLVESIGEAALSEEQKEKIQQALLDEMYEKGLEQNDEPNSYGKQLDSIIGKIE